MSIHQNPQISHTNTQWNFEPSFWPDLEHSRALFPQATSVYNDVQYKLGYKKFRGSEDIVQTLTEINLCYDLNLEYSKPIFSLGTLAYDDQPNYVCFQNYYFRFSQLVCNWILTSCEPHGITSGWSNFCHKQLQNISYTRVNLSSSQISKINPYTKINKTHMHKHETHIFEELVPAILPLLKQTKQKQTSKNVHM